jgi:hypothetical protein
MTQRTNNVEKKRKRNADKESVSVTQAEERREKNRIT